MDFKDQIKQLGDRVDKLKVNINTEEATKNAFVMPFIQCLGYDVFNPLEVVPEFISDIGIKKGEKIDYAIMKDHQPCVLVECKHWNQDLSIHDGQLLRYFHVSPAKFSILTNGVIYKFYSDLVTPNRMDEKPFLEFNITEIKDGQIEELKKFHKAYFDEEGIANTASELKYMNELKILIQKEFNEPTGDFVKHFAKQVYPGVVTAKILEQFTALLKKSLQQNISDNITARLKVALAKENKEEEIAQAAENDKKAEQKINTTDAEIQSFLIIKAILAKVLDVERVVFRDSQSYFAILLDNNNRKTIIRMFLNSDTNKFFCLLDDNKKEVRYNIDKIDELYKYSDDILKSVNKYL
ncbi:MAG TPA: type I restriction endonuclease [Arachidicoccus sp.]|nr:type I restriction endonuclease [Arachidicoccus sp.]